MPSTKPDEKQDSDSSRAMGIDLSCSLDKCPESRELRKRRASFSYICHGLSLGVGTPRQTVRAEPSKLKLHLVFEFQLYIQLFRLSNAIPTYK